MENAIYIGLSQQMALKRRMDITANNIANMNTTAFKSAHPLFEEYLVDKKAGDQMSYVHDYGTYRSVQEGALEPTNRPLDLAIKGDGFFTIGTDNGPRYTRNGNFKLDTEGNIVTQRGDFLLDEKGSPIQINQENMDLDIASDGTVTLGPEETEKLQLVKFENSHDLKVEGDGYYNAGEEEPIPTEKASILQGSLERSNVNPILEMTTMVDVLRSYQAAQKLLDAEHDMQMKSIEELPAIQ